MLEIHNNVYCKTPKNWYNGAYLYPLWETVCRNWAISDSRAQSSCDSFSRLIARDERTVVEAAMTRSGRAGVRVLLENGPNHFRFTVRTFYQNVVNETGRKAALAREEWLFATERTGLGMSNTRRTEQVAACNTLARTDAVLKAHRALELVVQVNINTINSLNHKRNINMISQIIKNIIKRKQ